MSGVATRQAPTDLVAMADRLDRSVSKTALHYGVGRTVTRRWFVEAGIALRPTQKARPRPADLLEMRAKLGSVENLQKHYRAASETVKRWLEEVNAPRLHPQHRKGKASSNRRPVPDDFAVIAPTMTKAGLMEHYRTNNRAVDRWLAETGAAAATYVPAPTYSRPTLRYVRAPSHSNIAPTRTYSAEDAAADVLRKWAAVYRCKPNGRADHKGTHWRMGNTVLTGPELIQRAERKAPVA